MGIMKISSTPYSPPYYPCKLEKCYGKYKGMYAWQCAIADAPAWHYIIYGYLYDNLRNYCYREDSWCMKIYKSFESAIEDGKQAGIEPLIYE